jgi:hypothetical protein
VFPLAGAALPTVMVRGGSSPAGVDEPVRMSNRGFPGTWEILPFPRTPSAVGVAEPEEPLAHRTGVLAGGSELQDAPVVPPSEGNLARREGR